MWFISVNVYVGGFLTVMCLHAVNVGNRSALFVESITADNVDAFIARSAANERSFIQLVN